MAEEVRSSGKVTNNGLPTAVGGIGVKGPSMEISEPLVGDPQESYRAEIFSVILAIRRARHHVDLTVFTKSKHVADSYNIFSLKWMANDGFSRRGNPIKYMEMWRDLHNTVKGRSGHTAVKFEPKSLEHPDRIEADRLANLGKLKRDPHELVEFLQALKVKTENSNITKDVKATLPGLQKVWTDGACSSNGQLGCRAGVGVYWGDNDPRNVCQALEGKQTNQRAELQAVVCAVKSATPGMKLLVYCDSIYVVNGYTLWVDRWIRNKWRRADGQPTANKDQWTTLLNAITELGAPVTIKHVKGHSGNHGNTMADSLARKGIPRGPSPPVTPDHDLKVDRIGYLPGLDEAEPQKPRVGYLRVYTEE